MADSEPPSSEPPADDPFSGMSFLQKAKMQAAALADQATRIDEAIGSWEEKVFAKTKENVAAGVEAAGDSVVNATKTIVKALDNEEAALEAREEQGLSVQELLVLERRRRRDLKDSMELQRATLSSSLKQAESARDQAKSALGQSREELQAHETTIRGLEVKIAEYAELLPAWEKKKQEEHKKINEERDEQLTEELAKVRAACEGSIAATQRELELERSTKATLEFSLAESFGAKARAKDASVDVLEDQLHKLNVLVPTLTQERERLSESLSKTRTQQKGLLEQAAKAEHEAAHARHEASEAKLAMQSGEAVRAQLQHVVDDLKRRLSQAEGEHAETTARHRAESAQLRRQLAALSLCQVRWPPIKPPLGSPPPRTRAPCALRSAHTRAHLPAPTLLVAARRAVRH